MTKPVNKVTLFKTYQPVMNLQTPAGVAHFIAQRFSTTDEALEAAVKKAMEESKVYGIYIDPEEPTVEKTEDIDIYSREARILESQHYQATRQVNLNKAARVRGGMANTAHMSGKDVGVIATPPVNVTEAATDISSRLGKAAK